MAVGRLFTEIGKDVDRLNASLRDSMNAAKEAGVQVTASGQRMLAAFDKALNPTKDLAEQIKLLEKAGKSSSDVWAVYGNQMKSAADAATKNGQAVDPLIAKHLELNKVAASSGMNFTTLGKSIQDFARNPVEAAKAGMTSMLASMGPLAVGIGAVGIAVGIAGKALFDMGAQMADQAENLKNLSISTGLSTQSIQALGQISKEAGLEGLDLAKIVGQLNKQLGSDEGGDFTKALLDAGIALEDSSGKTKDAVTLLDELRNSFKQIIDPAERAQAMHNALGGRLRDLIPLLMGNNEGLAEQIRLMKETGPVWDDITQNKLLAFDDTLDRIGRTWAGIVTDIKVGVVSIVSSMAELSTGSENALDKAIEAARRAKMTDAEKIADAIKTQGGKKITGIPGLSQFDNVNAESLESAPKISRELFIAQQRLIAQGEEQLQLKSELAAAQKEFDRLVNKGTTEQIAQQALVVKGINEQIKTTTDLAKAAESTYWGISDGLMNLPKNLNESISDTLETLGNQADFLLNKQLDKANEKTKELNATVGLSAEYWKELGEAAVAATEMDIKELSSIIDLQEDQYKGMIKSVADGAGSVFDAIVSRGKGAFSDIGDWIEGVFLSRLRQLFQNLMTGIFDGFQDGFSGILKGVIPGIGGGGGIGLSALSAGLGIGGLAVMPAMSVLGSGMNPAAKAAILSGLGITGLAGVSTAALGGGAGLFGTILGGALTNPWTAGIAGAAIGGVALADWAKGPNTYEAASKEVSRDFGGVKISDDQYKAFMDAAGISEGQGWGSRAQMNRSPEFLINTLLPLAKAQGKMESLLASFDKNGSQGAGQGSWGGISFRSAVELGNATGDWSKLNEIWTETKGLADQLNASIPGMGDKLSVAGEAAMNAQDQMIQNFYDLQQSIEASIPPIEDMYSKFLATGTITDEFAAKIKELGGDLEKFQKAAELNLELSGLQKSLSFISSLSSAIAGLAPELDPINQILSGNIGAEAIAALAGAGLDPSKLSGLSGLIGMKSAMEGAQPFGKLTDTLRQALLSYGGSEGSLAVERYGQGVNTLSADLLASTRDAMNQAYLDSVKDALGYLQTAQDETVDKMTAITDAINASKMDIVAELDKILYAITGTSGNQGVITNPVNSHGGATPEQYMQLLRSGQSGQPIVINGNIYGWDDFVAKVRQAGSTLNYLGTPLAATGY